MHPTLDLPRVTPCAPLPVLEALAYLAPLYAAAEAADRDTDGCDNATLDRALCALVGARDALCEDGDTREAQLLIGVVTAALRGYLTRP